jgi:hypothetical protein
MRPPQVMDVVPKWSVDAVFFFVLATGFLLWGILLRSAPATILTFAVMAIIALLLDRMSPVLERGLSLADADEPPPPDAMRRTWAGYAATAAPAIAVLCAILVALAVDIVPPGFFAGWLTAFCFARLRSLVSAREIEQATGVRLSIRLERSVWRRRTPVYYATPIAG